MTALDLEDLLPTDAEVAFYRQHGWYVSRRILDEQAIEDALFGIDRFYAGERDHILPIRRGYLDWKPEHGDGVLRQNDYVSLQNDEIRDLVSNRVIAAIAARLSGATTIRLFHDQLIYKPPSDDVQTTVGWHSDRSYWKTCVSEKMLTAWVPFVPTSEASGTLTMIDGSHRWPNVERFNTFNDRDLQALERQFDSGDAPVVRVPMELEPGQVSFHHCRLLHGSMPNRSSGPRIALAIHMQDETNAYRRHLDDNGDPILHVNDVLCRSDGGGKPDYADPDICPILGTFPEDRA